MILAGLVQSVLPAKENFPLAGETYLHQPVKDKSSSARQHRLYLAALEEPSLTGGTDFTGRPRSNAPHQTGKDLTIRQSKAVSAYQGRGEDASLAGSDPLFNGSLVQMRDVLFAKSHQSSH
ncbi:hypothetical protein PCANC_21416 [Puccinia coronata f. sp. avenae]|uniref:Uncharacterized protein n=1 Tax=Puccinia coronata f. sp. avenae TaxID=200324 RepID=A0A2N5UTC3_9BASI|nr:hypothetical protein PCANC_21416 [Puccinia coronata f. sp. avenae]